MRPEFERAATSGDVLALETLLQTGADVDAKDRYGETALMLAARGGHLVAVEALLRAGADLELRGSGAPGFWNQTAGRSV